MCGDAGYGSIAENGTYDENEKKHKAYKTSTTWHKPNSRLSVSESVYSEGLRVEAMM